MDTNGDGVIDITELTAMVHALKADQGKPKPVSKGGSTRWSKNYWTASKYVAPPPTFMPTLAQVDPEDLEEYLQGLFAIADVNNDGVLEADEFEKLMYMSGFGFPKEKVLQVMAEADTNNDGVLDIAEVTAMIAKIQRAAVEEEQEADEEEEDNETVEDDGDEAMPPLEEVSDEDLAQYLKELFAIADKNGDGVLQADEFHSLMSLSGFAFPEHVIAGLMKIADVNDDGVIDITELTGIINEIKANDYKAPKRTPYVSPWAKLRPGGPGWSAKALAPKATFTASTPLPS